MNKKSILIALGILTCGAANANEWKGSGEAGILINSGNSDSRNANIGLNFEKKATIWGHEMFLGFINNEANDVETADSQKFDYTLKRDLSKKSFLFGGFNYLDDGFDGLTDQKAISAGYGYRVIDTDKVKFELGGGLGYRDTANAILDANGFETGAEGTDLAGATLVGTAKYSNKLTANTQFYNNFRIEPGEENTYVENDLGVIVNMSKLFALKASVNTRRNSEPTAGTESTDTISSLSLVYNFNK